jgi:hypothetical protein
MMAMRRGEHPRSQGGSTLPDGAASRVIALLRECPDDKFGDNGSVLRAELCIALKGLSG